MPFIGQDWRSPGEQWVKTSEGWERMKLWRVKIFENLNENVFARINRLAIERDDTPRSQPHVLFNSGGSKEKNEATSLGEALVRLDMAGAARDITRANYVFELLLIILDKTLPTLSGTSQKLIFNIIESMLNEALRSELNFGLVKEIINCAKKTMSQQHIRYIGSQKLWKKHQETVERLSKKLTDYSVKERITDGRITLCELPTECLRTIFSQIPDHKDLMRVAQTSLLFKEVTQEWLLWKSMCFFHFSNSQINTFVNGSTDERNIDWKYIYRRCYKRFGKKNIYADMLSICSYCCSIFWKSLGHPCVCSKPTTRCKDLSPKDFMALFKL